MKRLILALTVCSFVFLSAGCGQSGPLYIPGNPSKISNPPPPDESAAEEEDPENGEKNGDADKE
jgi:predicted small lipoprotein YifL